MNVPVKIMSAVSPKDVRFHQLEASTNARVKQKRVSAETGDEVPYENIIGRPMFLYWSFQQPRDEYTRTSIADRLRFLFTIVIHFFDQTRWSRMFHVVR